MVEDVEKFAPELEPESLGDGKFLEYRKIHIAATRTAQDSPPGISKGKLHRREPRGSGGIERRLEPMRDRRVVDVPISHHISPGEAPRVPYPLPPTQPNRPP